MSNVVKFEQKQQEMDHFRSIASMAFRSGNYAGMNEMSMLNIILSANDLGVSPHKALNGGFYIVNGKICMSTSLMADRIRKEGHSIKIPEWTRDKCVVIGVRKDNGDSVKFEFTMEDAQAAGLTNSPTWKKFPKNMLYNRAMSTLARVLFPDVVGNAYSEDEKWDIMNVPPEKRPLEDVDSIEVTSTIRESRIVATPEMLKAELEKSGLPVESFDECMLDIADRKKQTVEEVAAQAQEPHLIERFKEFYAKQMEKKAG